MATPQEAYLQRIMPHAERIAQKFNTHPFLIAAQMAMENKWGQSILKDTYNHGNVMELRNNVDGVYAMDNGNRRKFRKFASDDDFFNHLGGLYERKYSGIRGMTDPYQYGHYLYKQGYAENPNYGRDMVAMYNSVARRMPGYKWNGKATMPLPQGSTNGTMQMMQGGVEQHPQGHGVTPLASWQHQPSTTPEQRQQDFFAQQPSVAAAGAGSIATADGMNPFGQLSNAYLQDYFLRRSKQNNELFRI